MEELMPVVSPFKNGFLEKKDYDKVKNLTSSTLNSSGVFIINTGLDIAVDQYAIVELTCNYAYSDLSYLTLGFKFINRGGNKNFKKMGTYTKNLKLFVFENKIHLYVEVENAFGFFSVRVKTSNNTTFLKITDLKKIPEEATNIISAS